MHILFLIVLAGAGLGCRGTMPTQAGDPDSGMSAILVRGRLLSPRGEMSEGTLELNLQSDARSYILRFYPKQTSLYVIEPGSYRLTPTRGLFGTLQSTLAFSIGKDSFRIPVSEEMLAHPPIVVKPGSVVALGTLEAKFTPTEDRARVRATAEFDDRVETRWQLLQDMVRGAVNASSPEKIRERAVVWSWALDRALVDLQQEAKTGPSDGKR